MKILLGLLFLFIPFVIPEPTFAHAFGATFTLPLPSWIFLYGGAATVALSFLLVSFFVEQKDGQKLPKQIDISSNWLVRIFNNRLATVVGRTIGLAMLI